MKKGILYFALAILLLPNHSMALDKLKVLSYNVWGMPFPVRLNHKGLRKAPKELPKLGAHIIGMQEVFIKRAKKLAEMKEYPFVAWGAGPKGMKVLSSGLLIASKFPILESDTISYDSCRGSDCLARKGALYARILVPGYGEIDVINTHLNAGTNKKVKKRQLKQLLAFVNSKKSSRPLILMGDFNFRPTEVHYEDFESNFILDDAHRIHLDQNPDAPKSVRDGYTYKLKIGPIKIQRKLDYILHNLNQVNYKVVYTDEDDLPRLSDHFGITAEFEL